MNLKKSTYGSLRICTKWWLTKLASVRYARNLIIKEIINNKQYTQYSFYRRIEGSTIYIIIICPVNGCRVSSLLLLSNSDYTFRLSLKSRDYRYIPTSNKD